MEVINDNGCSWIKDLNPRTNIKILESNKNCDWLIIGAGYTGLSAARKLGQIYPNQKILLVDAQLAGEGASSRNSGYLVDTTLNDGFTSNKILENYKEEIKKSAAGFRRWGAQRAVETGPAKNHVLPSALISSSLIRAHQNTPNGLMLDKGRRDRALMCLMSAGLMYIKDTSKNIKP